jgi:hypothetical protein
MEVSIKGSVCYSKIHGQRKCDDEVVPKQMDSYAFRGPIRGLTHVVPNLQSRDVVETFSYYSFMQSRSDGG